MPLLRGKISQDEYKLGHFDDSAAVLEFVCSADLAPLAALGTSCPDHFLRTKIRPLVIDFDPPPRTSTSLVAGLDQALGRLPRRLHRLLRALQARQQPGKCATPTRSST
jgi:rhamnose utilization protein RhaD (predicted bifunctional aldolase and dehydrogenase)